MAKEKENFVPATDEEMARAHKVAKASNLVKITVLNGPMPQVEVEYLNQGDVFQIPAKGDELYENRSFNKAPAFLCTFEKGTKVRPVYVSTFTKTAQQVDDDLVPVGDRQYCKGSFVDAWRSYDTKQEAWEGLQNRFVKVKSVWDVQIRRFGTSETRNTQLYELELLPE